jgi:excisionase family DNA binding protein
MNEMLTAKDVQGILQVDRSTIYRMAEDGRLPALKIGRQWRFQADQIETWLATRSPVTAVTSSPPATLANLLPQACVQLIQDSFAEMLGVMFIITDMDGSPVTHFSNPCSLFAALQHSDRLWQNCMAHWRQMAESLGLEPRFMPSYLGLLCARAYIRVDNALRGMVFVGGLAPEQWPPAAADAAVLAQELKVAPALITDHQADVYWLTENQWPGVLTAVQRLADIVSHIVHERQKFVIAV